MATSTLHLAFSSGTVVNKYPVSGLNAGCLNWEANDVPAVTRAHCECRGHCSVDLNFSGESANNLPVGCSNKLRTKCERALEQTSGNVSTFTLNCSVNFSHFHSHKSCNVIAMTCRTPLVHCSPFTATSTPFPLNQSPSLHINLF